MSIGNVVVSQDAPAKNNLWIQPKGTARFWNGSFWKTISGSGGSGNPTNLSDLDDISLSSLTNGQILKYNSTTQKWENTNIGDLSNYYTKAEANTNFLSKNFFKKLFQAHYGSSDVNPENPTADSSIVVDSIEAMFGFWTEQYISALGQNSSQSGGGGMSLSELWEYLEDEHGGVTTPPYPEININLLPEYVRDAANIFPTDSSNTINRWYKVVSFLEGITYPNTLISVINGYLPTSLAQTTPEYYINIKGNADTATTASKLSVNEAKKVWGQTYLNSSGEPQTVTGNISNAGNITSNSSGNRNLGSSSNKWKTLYVNQIQIGNAIISFNSDSNVNMLEVSGVTGTTFNGLYSTEAISALGANPSGGGSGGGLDLTALWNELTKTSPYDSDHANSQLDVTRIPVLNITSKTSGTLPVNRGGTGATSLSGVLIGNGTNAISGRTIMNNTSSGALGWTSSTGDGTYIPTVNTLAYWNGAYSGTSSNLKVLGTVTTGTWNASTIGIGYGGTGATTAKGAEYNILSEAVTALETDFTNATRFAIERTNPSATNGVLIGYRTASQLWSYIKGKMSSDSAVNISGNAATATTASKLGTSTVGATNNPIYLSNGVATVCGIFPTLNPTGETAINTNDDLNTYTTPGVFGTTGGSSGSSVAASLSNCPLTTGFKMIVQTCGKDSTYLRQTINAKNGQTFVRTASSSNSVYTWGNWKHFPTSTVAAVGSTTNPVYVDANGDINNCTYSLSSTVNGGTANRLAYYTSSGIDDASTTYVSNTKLAINSTSEPTENLYVNGKIGVTDTIIYSKSANQAILTNVYNSTTYNLIRNHNNGNISISASSGDLYLGYENTTKLDFLNGKGKWTSTGLGIGISSPQCKLHLNVDSTSGCEARVANSNGAISLYTATNRGIYDRTTSTWLIATDGTNSWLSRGNVGIGTTTPPVKLSVEGDIYASGGVTALQTVTSDKRFKKNIKKFEAKDIIEKLQPVEFEWNNKAKKYSDTFKDGKNFGLIAQDSDGIIDNLVFDLPNGKGYKGVRYEKLIPILLQAVKEQQSEINELKQIIKDLKYEILNKRNS